MPSVLALLVWFVALSPVLSAALWVAGGILFHLRDEDTAGTMPPEGWPGGTGVVPAQHQELAIARTVRAALSADYPELEVLVLDDGSTDATSAAATAARRDDRRCQVVRD